MPQSKPLSQTILLGMGVIGGVWASLLPLLVFLPIFEPKELSEPMVQNTALGAGRFAEALTILIPFSGLGLLGLASTISLERQIRFSRITLSLIAAICLTLTVLTAGTIGWFLFPAAVLFAFPAIWMNTYREQYDSPNRS